MTKDQLRTGKKLEVSISKFTAMEKSLYKKDGYIEIYIGTNTAGNQIRITSPDDPLFKAIEKRIKDELINAEQKLARL